ncbi:MAG TPA: DUF2304 domain-containing protein [Azoarcus taiwanensis]|nr:DUF2304 domain-containing protein [Azoarcus taiwanensis]
MASLQLTAALLGLGLAVFIVLLVRRDHLHLSHGVFWISIAFAAALLGLWPHAIDRIAVWAGVTYSPTLMLLVAVMVLLLKSLYNDMLVTRFERQIRRLNQRLAIFEAESFKRDDS